jgi:hypothetical protein
MCGMYSKFSITKVLVNTSMRSISDQYHSESDACSSPQGC